MLYYHGILIWLVYYYHHYQCHTIIIGMLYYPQIDYSITILVLFDYYCYTNTVFYDYYAIIATVLLLYCYHMISRF